MVRFPRFARIISWILRRESGSCPSISLQVRAFGWGVYQATGYFVHTADFDTANQHDRQLQLAFHATAQSTRTCVPFFPQVAFCNNLAVIELGVIGTFDIGPQFNVLLDSERIPEDLDIASSQHKNPHKRSKVVQLTFPCGQTPTPEILPPLPFNPAISILPLVIPPIPAIACNVVVFPLPLDPKRHMICPL
jgi:hypothetical protein